MSTPFEGNPSPRFARGVRLHRDDARGHWVLLGPERVFKPDEVALEVLQRVNGQATIEAIVDDLAQRYSADRNRIDTDVRTLLGDLVDKGMVEFVS